MVDVQVDASLIKIIQLLSEGESYSGSRLGEKLGLTRAAVWKKIKQLEAIGVHIESSRQHGYRIPGGFDLLDRNTILNAVGSGCDIPLNLAIHHSIASTNSELMALAGSRQSLNGEICLAEMQSGGRGRRGREWVSPFGRNIYMSLGWSFEGGATQLEGLSLAVGVVICEALASVAGVNVGLKWPNDFYMNGKKLGGILIEMSGDVSGLCHAVVGIGLNVKQERGDLIDQPWTDLTSSGAVIPERSVLVASLIHPLIKLFQGYANTGFPPYQTRWEALNVHRGQVVTVSSPKEKVSGRFIGICENGALKLQCSEGERTFLGGEVSLRGDR